VVLPFLYYAHYLEVDVADYGAGALVQESLYASLAMFTLVWTAAWTAIHGAPPAFPPPPAPPAEPVAVETAGKDL
jgi:hypothetical protein